MDARFTHLKSMNTNISSVKMVDFSIETFISKHFHKIHRDNMKIKFYAFIFGNKKSFDLKQRNEFDYK